MGGGLREYHWFDWYSANLFETASLPINGWFKKLPRDVAHFNAKIRKILKIPSKSPQVLEIIVNFHTQKKLEIFNKNSLKAPFKVLKLMNKNN